MTQPQWRLIANLGDRSADFGNLDYGAYYIYEDVTGVYPPEADLVDAPVDEDGTYYVYRFSLGRCTYVDGVLSDNPYHPDMSVWFAPNAAERAERPQNSNLAQLCESMDTTEDEFIALITSANPLERAQAWRMVGEYHGFDNLDSYPLTLTRAEIDVRYSDVHLESKL